MAPWLPYLDHVPRPSCAGFDSPEARRFTLARRITVAPHSRAAPPSTVARRGSVFQSDRVRALESELMSLEAAFKRERVACQERLHVCHMSVTRLLHVCYMPGALARLGRVVAALAYIVVAT